MHTRLHVHCDIDGHVPVNLWTLPTLAHLAIRRPPPPAVRDPSFRCNAMTDPPSPQGAGKGGGARSACRRANTNNSLPLMRPVGRTGASHRNMLGMARTGRGTHMARGICWQHVPTPGCEGAEQRHTCDCKRAFDEAGNAICTMHRNTCQNHIASSGLRRKQSQIQKVLETIGRVRKSDVSTKLGIPPHNPGRIWLQCSAGAGRTRLGFQRHAHFGRTFRNIPTPDIGRRPPPTPRMRRQERLR